MNKTANVFGLKLSARSMAETVSWIRNGIGAGGGGVIYCCTLNEVQEYWAKNSFRKMFDKADLITADGMPLVWEMRRKVGFGERVYGPDLMGEIIYKTKISNIFVGDEKNRKYFEKYGKYIVLPMKKSFLDNDFKRLSLVLKKTKGEVVWLGLGARKQVEMAFELKKRGVKKIIITVGAAFDFLSGNKRQAPKWIRKLGAEWLFRLLSEPKRLWVRYFYSGRFLVSFYFKELIESIKPGEPGFKN